MDISVSGHEGNVKYMTLAIDPKQAIVSVIYFYFIQYWIYSNHISGVDISIIVVMKGYIYKKNTLSDAADWK